MICCRFQLAYETLTLLGLSMSYLEVGNLGICKFGERAEMLLPFTSHFTDDNGASIIGSLTCEQQKTNISQVGAVFAAEHNVACH